MPFVLSLLIRALCAVVARFGGSGGSKDLEIMVLRHQLKIMRRKAGRPRLTPFDRVVLATTGRYLPRTARASFIISPATVLRWHRELARRKWT
jgi:putative transposase